MGIAHTAPGRYAQCPAGDASIGPRPAMSSSCPPARHFERATTDCIDPLCAPGYHSVILHSAVPEEAWALQPAAVPKKHFHLPCSQEVGRRLRKRCAIVPWLSVLQGPVEYHQAVRDMSTGQFQRLYPISMVLCCTRTIPWSGVGKCEIMEANDDDSRIVESAADFLRKR